MHLELGAGFCCVIRPAREGNLHGAINIIRAAVEEVEFPVVPAWCSFGPAFLAKQTANNEYILKVGTKRKSHRKIDCIQTVVVQRKPIAQRPVVLVEGPLPADPNVLLLDL